MNTQKIWRDSFPQKSFAYLAYVVAFTTSGCKTLAPVAAVNQGRNEVVFVTTPDSRSATPGLARDRGVSDARQSLLAKVKANPADSSSLNDLARIALLSEKPGEAEAWAKKALRANTRDVESRKILAMVALQRKQFDLAEVFLNGLGGFQSEDSTVLNLIGQLRLGRGNNLLAAEAFKKALDLNPNDVATRMNLGVLYLRGRQYNPAGVQFERVLSVMPKHTDARIHLAIVDAQRGKLEQAIEVMEGALSERPDNELVLFNLAVMQRNAGKLDVAKKNFKRFLQLAKSRTDETEQVLAMLDDIQRQQSTDGNRVTDNEILTLAARIKASPAATRVEANEVPVDVLDERPEDRKSQRAINKQPDSVETNDIQDLEKALQ
jgi:Flp pilus assembly protein TadD